ncbi:ferritin family protein [bacterium]
MAKFKANELLEFAIRIEENGETFYKDMAWKNNNEKIKELFNYLADEETKHKDTFKSMLEKIEDYEPMEAYPDEYFLYLREYADEHIFNDTNNLSKKIESLKTDLEILDFAVTIEKDSILYYMEMKNLVSSNDKNVIENIIQEERMHYRKLVEIKKLL